MCLCTAYVFIRKISHGSQEKVIDMDGRVIRDIKLLHNKKKHQLVTIAEACSYLGLPYDEVFRMINKHPKPSTKTSP